MFQMSGVGPMFGQAAHFLRYAPEKIPYAIERYTNEAKRLARVLDTRLADRVFVAGDYSIADMAIFPWIHAAEQAIGGLEATPHLARWVASLRARPAVIRGLAVMKDAPRPTEMSEETRSILFGARQQAGR
jgi:GST-like protein